MSGIDFKVVYVAPGAHLLCDGPGEATLQILSLAQGTVHVVMCGKIFGVQTGGMWRLRGREQCGLRNVGAEEAVVHITSIRRE
jgi:hypothetical protein